MTFVGLDPHKCYITACALDSNGAIIAEAKRLAPDLDTLLAFLAPLPLRGGLKRRLGRKANAIHALRAGGQPYRPVGRPAPCPPCGATYYPDGSAQCWRCGPVP